MTNDDGWRECEFGHVTVFTSREVSRRCVDEIGKPRCASKTQPCSGLTCLITNYTSLQQYLIHVHAGPVLPIVHNVLIKNLPCRGDEAQ